MSTTLPPRDEAHPAPPRIHTEGAVRDAALGHHRAFLLVLLGYVAVRLLAWRTSTHLEDHDSTSYLTNARLLLSFDFEALSKVGPDHTPFYPTFTALFSLPGWSTEFGARLCSLAFSIALFCALFAIGRRFLDPRGVTFGLLLVAFSPVLLPLSISVLSEPSYIATVYLGLLLFWTQYEDPRLWKAGLLGIIFGLAFLNRIEGLVYLGVIPLLQAAHLLQEKRPAYPPRRLVKWTMVYALAFGLLATPQILWVSHQMGELAINGRQVWSSVLTSSDERSVEEKLRGLDFSPTQTNLLYLQTHPEARQQLASNAGAVAYAKLVLRNFDKLYHTHLSTLLGPAVLIFFVFGLVGLSKRRLYYPAFLVVAFVLASLVAPLLQSNLLVRHTAVVAPIILLVAGRGILDLVDALVPAGTHRLLRRSLPPALVLLAIGAWIIPLRDGLSERVNQEYDPAALREPTRIVREIQERELGRPAMVTARKAYLPYFAGATFNMLPFTDYPGLVLYLARNHADLLLLEYQHLGGRPFASDFQRETPPAGFSMLHRSTDEHGRIIALYRFHPAAAEQAAVSGEGVR